MSCSSGRPKFSRISVALMVSDLGDAVASYEQMLHEPPAACQRPAAQFVLDRPSLTLELIEDADIGGHLSHVALETSEPIGSLCAWLTERDVACDCHDDHAWLEAPDALPVLILRTQQ